jgi:hypothetical protein
VSEYSTCPACGTTQAAQQKFCGECGTPLREGVTRPLTAGERATLEDRARLVVPLAATPTQAWSGRESSRRPLLVLSLGLLLLMSLIAVGVFRRGSPAPQEQLVAVVPEPMAVIADSPPANARATPPDFILAERGVGVYLGQSDRVLGRPPVVITLTGTIVQPSNVPAACPNGITTAWIFDIENYSSNNANILVDPASIRLVDSTGQVYSGPHQCHLDLGDLFAHPISLFTGWKGSTAVTLDVDALPATATYLDLHMLISGQPITFRTPLP